MNRQCNRWVTALAWLGKFFRDCVFFLFYTLTSLRLMRGSSYTAIAMVTPTSSSAMNQTKK
jgi:hypothetical protein